MRAVVIALALLASTGARATDLTPAEKQRVDDNAAAISGALPNGIAGNGDVMGTVEGTAPDFGVFHPFYFSFFVKMPDRKTCQAILDLNVHGGYECLVKIGETK